MKHKLAVLAIGIQGLPMAGWHHVECLCLHVFNFLPGAVDSHSLVPLRTPLLGGWLDMVHNGALADLDAL